MQAGVIVERGFSVGDIFGVAVGGGASVGAAVAGVPQDEMIIAMARNIDTGLYMVARLCKMKLLHASIARAIGLSQFAINMNRDLIWIMDDKRPVSP
jgi:hypothetical protein